MIRFRAAICAALLVLAGCGTGTSADRMEPRRYTDIAEDESIVFFRTAGSLDTEASAWQLRIHGWVFEPEDSSFRRGVAEEVLKRKYGLTVDDGSEPVFSRRINWLITDNERGKTVFVRIGERDYEMPPSDTHGKFESVVSLPAAEAEALAVDGRIGFSAMTAGPSVRRFDGVVTLVPPSGVSVISDIDDTVKLSMITDRAKLLEYAVLREFEPAPGMPALYSDWSREGARFHYVSSSPWQLYPELDEFLAVAGLPADSLHLKRVRFRDETLFDLFAKGEDTKPAQIAPILARWPERTFVLVGDSGEHDPEVYAELLRRHPEQVRRVYIRNVTGARPDDDRFGALFDGIDAERWALFDDPASLHLPAD